MFDLIETFSIVAPIIWSTISERYLPSLDLLDASEDTVVVFLRVHYPNVNLDDFYEIIQILSADKNRYFQYRFPYLGMDQTCLEFWDDFFRFSDLIDSYESLQNEIMQKEIDFLNPWIKLKISSILNYFLEKKAIRENIERLVNELVKNDIDASAAIEAFIATLEKDILKHYNSYPSPPQLPISQTVSELFKSVFGVMVQKIPEQVSDISDVHAIIQASGFSTQNENSHMAILDFFNYIKYAEEIKNVRSVINAFIRPLLPLYWEWVYISKQPKNLINVIRLILPFLLLTLYLIGIETFLRLLPSLIPLLNIFYISEIALIFTMIINIYIGLVLLSYLYENIKMINQKLTDLWYGGHYEIPIYQVNERMTTMFGPNTAEAIRLIYIETMQELDATIADLESKQKISGLTIEENKTLKTSIEQRKKIEFEWMGVHHFKDLAIDEAQKIVKNRLIAKMCEKYSQFIAVKEADAKHMSSCIRSILVLNENALFQPQGQKMQEELESLSHLVQEIQVNAPTRRFNLTQASQL